MPGLNGTSLESSSPCKRTAPNLAVSSADSDGAPTPRSPSWTDHRSSCSSTNSCTSFSTRFREFVYSLVQRCSRSGVSLLFTFESVELFQVTRLSEVGMSHISDNVVLL